GSGTVAQAKAVGGAGGVLLGIGAAGATANTGGTVNGYIDTGVELPNGEVSISAISNTKQTATSLGAAAALLGIAAGASSATASSGVATIATLGANTTSNTGRTGDLKIDAEGYDDNSASTTAGSGGLIAGNAAVASTSNSSTVD